jgi:hypothetical protein
VRAGGFFPFDPSSAINSTPHLAARQLIKALATYYDKEAYVSD